MSNDPELGLTGAEPRAEDALSLRERYMEACAGCYHPLRARRRFNEYDAHRAVFASEIHAWLYEGNPREAGGLTHLAWQVLHEKINDGGKNTLCLTWSERNQRAYLGDGLFQYLQLLCGEAKKVYGQPTQPEEHI